MGKIEDAFNALAAIPGQQSQVLANHRAAVSAIRNDPTRTREYQQQQENEVMGQSMGSLAALKDHADQQAAVIARELSAPQPQQFSQPELDAAFAKAKPLLDQYSPGEMGAAMRHLAPHSAQMRSAVAQSLPLYTRTRLGPNASDKEVQRVAGVAQQALDHASTPYLSAEQLNARAQQQQLTRAQAALASNHLEVHTALTQGGSPVIQNTDGSLLTVPSLH